MLCEHPQPILDLQTVSFIKSVWRLIVYILLLESHCWYNLYKGTFFTMVQQPPPPPSGPRSPHCRGFAIILRHTTVGRTSLDEWSTRRRGLYLTTHNTRSRHTSMPLVKKRKEEILEELNVEPLNEKLRRYKSKLLRHVTRMNSSRMAKIMLNCRQNSQRRLGRSLKSLWDEAETDLRSSNWWRKTMMMVMMMMMINHSRKML
jgi:hypothetical protein